jgi:hypothetical protein
MNDPIIRLASINVEMGSHTYQELDGWTHDKLGGMDAPDFLRLIAEVISEVPEARTKVIEILRDYMGADDETGEPPF